jgi:hypothetical protein
MYGRSGTTARSSERASLVRFLAALSRNISVSFPRRSLRAIECVETCASWAKDGTKLDPA